MRGSSRSGLWRNRDWRLLWLGQSVSATGDMVFTMTVMLWIATIITKGQTWAPAAPARHPGRCAARDPVRGARRVPYDTIFGVAGVLFLIAGAASAAPLRAAGRSAAAAEPQPPGAVDAAAGDTAAGDAALS